MLAASIRSLVVDWASFYANHAALRTAVVFAHVGGLVAGGGAAMMADCGVLSAFRHARSERGVPLRSVRNTHQIVLVGLVLIIVSGVLLFAADVDTYLGSRLFWTKIALVALLMINGGVLTAAERRRAAGGDASWGILWWTALASLTLWWLTTLIGTALPNIG